MGEVPGQEPEQSSSTSPEQLPPPQVDLKGNVLLVEGKKLTTKTSPEALQTALETGREAIVARIEEIFEAVKAANPDSKELHPPSIEVMWLDKGARVVLTQAGIDNHSRVHHDIEDIQEAYHGLWNAIVACGFAPEVRSHMGKDDEVSILYLRVPETAVAPDLEHVSETMFAESEGNEEYDIDTLPDQLGIVKTPELESIEEQAVNLVGTEYSVEELRSLLIRHQEELRAIVETLNGDEYLRAQLGLLIAAANLKRDLGLLESYVEDLDDAWTMADQLGLDGAKTAIDSTIAEYIEAISPETAD